MANNPFRRYDGIQLRPRYSADPAQGKYGEMYYNTTVNRVRVVVNEAPLTWSDLNISPGTINDTTLRWTGTTWAENSSVRATAAGTIYAPDAATGANISLASGNATTNGNNGGGVVIRTGLGLGAGARGIIYFDTDFASAINDDGPIAIRGSLSTIGNNDGGDISISGGAGAGSGKRGVSGITGRYSEMQGDYFVRLNAVGTIDPVAIPALIGGTYINTADSRFRWYDGTNWRYLDEKGIEVVDLRDSTYLILPTSAPLTIDGVTVVTGDDVLFTALSGTKGIYRATVTGPSVSWVLRKVLKDPTGATFMEGDTVWVGNGTSYGNAMYNFNGAQWATVGNGPGSVIGAPLVWQGAFWAENPDLTLFSTVITPTPDTAPDAFPGATLTVRGGDKTAGTGNGGPLLLIGGQPGTGVAQAYGWFVYSAQPAPGDQIFVKADAHTATWTYVVGAPAAFQIQIGATLNDTLINTQAAIGAEFTAAELTVSYNPPDTIIVTAGSSYPGAAANGLFQLTETSTFITVTNTGGSGIFNNGVTGSPGFQGYVKINGQTIQLDAQHATDPVSAVITDVYYNTVENRFKYFDGTIWRPLGSGSGGGFVAQYYNSSTTTLPAAAPYSPDGVAVVTGDMVLFTGLTNPAQNNRVYKATVTGPSVTWLVQVFGQSPTSVPTDGDSVYITLGTTNSDTLWYFDGTTWYSVIGANKSLSNLTTTAINQSLVPAATLALGSNSNPWEESFIRISRIHDGSQTRAFLNSAITMPDGSTAGAALRGFGTFSIGVSTFSEGVADATATGALYLQTGNKTAGTGNSGDIFMRTGTSAGGTRGFIRLDAPTIRLGDATNYIELLPMQSFALAATQTNTTVFTYVAATYKTIFIEYQVVRNGATAAGYMQIANDGTTTAWSGNADDTGATGVTFDAVISGANVLLRYSSDANGAGTMKYHVRRW